MIMFQHDNNRGFTLMEVLVVVSIVTMGLLGVSSLSLQNVQVQSVNNEELVASLLAQEGIELVRNIRDRNWITSPYDQWKNDIANPSEFILDYDDNIPDHTISSPFDSAEIASMRLYLKDEYYAHDNTGTITKYHRYFETFSMTEAADTADALKVVCYVNWNSRGRNHTYHLESHLYNWR
jgi:prepilin-type N-terminal cleavage/methylation domain-containing protein